MPNINTILTVHYLAWDFENKIEKTGDVTNHTLYIIKDGTASPATNTPVEIDSTNAPGMYALELTAVENSGDSITIRGISSTVNVELVSISWSDNINVNQIEGKVLSGKTGSNFEVFFQNAASSTTKVVDDVGATATAGNLKTGGNLNSINDSVILSGQGKQSYCKVMLGTSTAGYQCRVIIERIAKVNTSSQYTRISPWLYKINVFDLSSSEAWDSTVNPKTTNIDLKVEIGIDASEDGANNNDNFSAGSYEPIFMGNKASSISNLEDGTTGDMTFFDIESTQYLVSINNYDNLYKCGCDNIAVHECFVGVGDREVESINQPYIEQTTYGPGFTEISFSVSESGSSYNHGVIGYYTYDIDLTPQDPTPSANDGYFSNGESAFENITGDDQQVYVKARIFGDEINAWYIPGQVYTEVFDIPSAGEGEGGY